MNRENLRSARKPNQKLRRQYRLESLEPRWMFAASALHDDNVNGTGYAVGAIPRPSESQIAAAATTAAQTSGPISSLLSIPKLNSLPGAKASIFLDFDGHFEADWLGFLNVTTPVFDTDNKPASFSQGELDLMTRIWEYVAEDYAPFNINVTTVLPKSFADGVSVRIAIGDGGWYSASAGGVAPLNAFTNGAPNVGYVFLETMGGNAKYIAEATSHEAGHTFGLEHQSLWNGATKVQEYHPGFPDGRGLIMGVSYDNPRATWWVGANSTSSTTIQDDMAVIANATNGFGYRLDDHGNKRGLASEFVVSPSSEVAFSGVLSTTLDVDYFSFTTGEGPVSFTATVPKNVNNLDLRLELRDSRNRLLHFVNPANSFDATLTFPVTEGRYTLVVASQGASGDVGPYVISGAVAKFSVNAPQKLKASVATATVTNLSWTDKANNEKGFEIERSTNGKTWQRIGTTLANRTTFADTQVKAGVSYQYRVRAQSAIASSIYSNVVTTNVAAPKPLAPSQLAATATSSQVTLRWRDNSGNETKFIVQRSSDNGRTWQSLGNVAANQSTIIDRKIDARATYRYRVAAVNNSGQSAFSNTASVTTPGVVLASQSVAQSNRAETALSSSRASKATVAKPVVTPLQKAVKVGYVDHAFASLTSRAPTAASRSTASVDNAFADFQFIGRLGRVWA